MTKYSKVTKQDFERIKKLLVWAKGNVSRVARKVNRGEKTVRNIKRVRSYTAYKGLKYH